MRKLEQFKELSGKYDEMTQFLIGRARAKSAASFEERNEYTNRIIQDGRIHSLDFWEEGIHVEFQSYSQGSLDEHTIYLDAAELEMSDSDFESHLKEQFAHILRARETRARIQQRDVEQRERELLSRLQAKYGDQHV